MGGQDLEMVTISAAITAAGLPVADKNLGWGAKASAYQAEIGEAVRSGFAPVLVELDLDTTLPEGTVVIDHHGAQAADKPASIIQVLALIGQEPSRHQQLVAANDVGFAHGLLRFGATATEISGIRAADRAAQNITPEQEAAAEAAVASMRVEDIGVLRLGVVDNLADSRFAPVSDRVFCSGKVDVVVCIHRGEKREIQLEWYPELVRALDATFADKGWSGYQYWGSTQVDPDEALAFIRGWLGQNGSPDKVSQPSPRTLSQLAPKA